MKDVFIHPTALVETTTIGRGTRIWAYAHVLAGAEVGENCNIGDHCFIEGGARVGNNVTLKNGNMVWEGVTLEDDVFVGPHVFFTNDRYPRSPRMPASRRRYADKRNWLVSTLVCRGATLGAGAVLLPGITVGSFALVAAGAVVTRPVSPYSVVMGNPARPVGWVCECGRPLRKSKGILKCRECGLSFRRRRKGLVVER